MSVPSGQKGERGDAQGDAAPVSATKPMQGFDTHLCLVSQQATPNLTPVLDPGFRPRRVVLVVTPDMRQRAQWLEDAMRSRAALKVERIDVPDAWDMHAILDTLIAWLDAQAPDATIALNVTGGTKPMAMAAQQAFAMAGRAVFYVRQAQAEVLWLEPRQPSFVLANRLSLEDYLRAHGWKVVHRPPTRPPAPRLTELAQDLVMGIRDRAPAIGRLNHYARLAGEKGWDWISLDREDCGNGGFVDMLRQFERAGACRVDGDKLNFPDEASRFFCNGGWLEDYVAEVVRGLAGQVAVQDWACGLKVRSLDNNLKEDRGGNELDLALLAHNRLHLIECKTSNLRGEGAATDALYKLDALTALGGLNTASMLVSYRELADGERQRAKDLGIRTCVGSQLATLGSTLRQWIGSRS